MDIFVVTVVAIVTYLLLEAIDKLQASGSWGTAVGLIVLLMVIWFASCLWIFSIGTSALGVTGFILLILATITAYHTKTNRQS